MKNKKSALILICLFFVYMLLSLFNLMYWTPAYEGYTLVRLVGELTDGENLELLWMPGQFPTFIFNTIAGIDVMFFATGFTFLTGCYGIIKLFKLSVKDIFGTVRSHKR